MKKKMKSSMNTHLGSQEALNVIKNRIDEFAHTIHSLTNY